MFAYIHPISDLTRAMPCAFIAPYRYFKQLSRLRHKISDTAKYYPKVSKTHPSPGKQNAPGVDDLARSQFCLVCQHKLGHAVEAKVVLRDARGTHGRAPALVRVAAIDPGRCKSEVVGWRVVVE